MSRGGVTVDVRADGPPAPATIDHLIERVDAVLLAEARSRRDRTLAPLERGLARRVADVFRLQQGAALRKLAPLKDSFPSPVSEAVRLADLERVLDAVVAATRRLFVRAVQSSAEEAVRAGADAALGDLAVGTSFDLANPRAVAFLRDYGAGRVTAIDATTREQLRAILVQGTDEGWAYGRTSKAIADYFISLRAEPPTRAEGKAIRSRARLIAVTEVGEAYSQGSLLAAQSLAADGMTVEKSSLTAGDSRVSATCRANAAAGWLALDADFPSGHARPLFHVGCRCALLSRVAP